MTWQKQQISLTWQKQSKSHDLESAPLRMYLKYGSSRSHWQNKSSATIKNTPRSDAPPTSPSRQEIVLFLLSAKLQRICHSLYLLNNHLSHSVTPSYALLASAGTRTLSSSSYWVNCKTLDDCSQVFTIFCGSINTSVRPYYLRPSCGI